MSTALFHFSANDGTTGYELWKSDGTNTGTVRVSDILPGTGGSAPFNLTNINGTLYFIADDGASGTELWRSDGTPESTVRVSDIGPGSLGSYPDNLTNVNGTLYFAANDGTAGLELWKYDRTNESTERVRDIRPDSFGSYPRYLTNVNGTLFFAANDGTGGLELWKSDGTNAGTVLVSDIRPGSLSSYLGNLTNVNGTLYFVANDGTAGFEIWKSDGTAESTVRVSDIRPGYLSPYPGTLTNGSGTLYFVANDGTAGFELWKSDGTNESTERVSDIRPGSGSSSPRNLTNVNGSLYFSANDGTSGYELWRSNGTPETTVRVSDIRPEGGSSSPGNLTNMNGTLYFVANDGTTGMELWKSDGTNAGTVRVNDIRPGISLSSSPRNLTNVNGSLYFSANDGSRGRELWKLVNEAPTAIAISSSTIAENAGVNAVVGSLSTTDPDAGDTFTYSLVSGAGDINNALFNISDNSLRATSSFDFETKSSYTVRVRGTDQGGLTFDQQFTITVTDANEAPTALSLSATAIAENAGVNAVVGSLSTTDPDAGDTFTYSLVSGAGDTDNALFNISNNSLRATSSFDFETKSSYTVRVRATDQGGLKFDQQFTITVTNIADGPSILAPSSAAMVTNLASFVTGLSVVDSLAGATRLTTTLSVPTGKLTLGTRTGLVFQAGDGVSDALIKFTGTLAQTNSALKSLSYITATDTLAGTAMALSTQRGAFVARASVALVPAENRVARVSDPALAGKVSVVIQGTGARDTVSVLPVGTSTSSYKVTLNGITTAVTGITGRIVAFGLDGDDDIDLSSARVAVRVDGGEGNDVILGGRVADVLFGGNGADLIAGGVGADTINGGAGNDIVADGGVAVRTIGKTHRSILDQWAALPTPGAADFVALTADTTFTPDKATRDTLTGGLGTDWFWSATAGAVADVLDLGAGERRRLV